MKNFTADVIIQPNDSYPRYFHVRGVWRYFEYSFSAQTDLVYASAEIVPWQTMFSGALNVGSRSYGIGSRTLCRNSWSMNTEVAPHAEIVSLAMRTLQAAREELDDIVRARIRNMSISDYFPKRKFREWGEF